MGRVSDTRERLIAAAIDLVWQQGVAAVTVDSICDAAQVRKGSFYHFFSSKADLVLAALDSHWSSRRPLLDRTFSPSVPPLDRLRDYFDYVYRRQTELKLRYGSFVGCFYSAVGMSCAGEDARIGARVREILHTYTRYYETALRDAVARGEIADQDVVSRAKDLFAFMEGVLGQARMRDDAELVRRLGDSAFTFLGIDGKRAATARKRGQRA